MKKSVKEESSHSPMNTNSILLFIFLFSFGLLWNLDFTIFNSISIQNLQNTKVPFLSQPIKNQEDPTINQLLDKIQIEGEETKYHSNLIEQKQLKKDVEICCF